MGAQSVQVMVAAVAATGLAGCGIEVEPVTKDAVYETSLGLLPTQTFADFTLPKSRGTGRMGRVTGYDAADNRVFYVTPRFSDEEVSKFDYLVTLSQANNNMSDAGLRQTLQVAKSMCDLAAVPTSEEVDLTQGLTAYFHREYFFRCPEAEKEIQ